MLSHVMIGSNDIDKTRRFYSAVLDVLGAGAPMEHKNDTGQTRLAHAKVQWALRTLAISLIQTAPKPLETNP